jgi:hypothetical protein
MKAGKAMEWKKIETKQAALFVNPNESRKSTKEKHMAVIALGLF